MGYFSNDKLYTAAVRMIRKIQYDSNHLITSLTDGWSLSCYDDVIVFRLRGPGFSNRSMLCHTIKIDFWEEYLKILFGPGTG